MAAILYVFHQNCVKSESTHNITKDLGAIEVYYYYYYYGAISI